MTDVTLRLARDTDVAPLARLRWAAAEEDGGAAEGSFSQFAQEFREWFRAEGDRFAVWVAEHAGRLVGTVWVEVVVDVPRPGRLDARWGYVTAVWVDEDLRGQGVGTALVEAACDWAREEQLELLVVWPSEESVPLWERAGFGVPPSLLELPLDER